MRHFTVGAQRAAPLQPSHRHAFLWLTLIILLAGFAVRILLYDYHGLEGDDAYSLSLSRLPVNVLVPGLMAFELDIHPPLHFLLVKGWTGVVGESLLSLRLLNYLMDMGIGALLLRLAGRSLNRQVALVAGVLWTIAPLLLASDLLVRMYTLLALLAMIGFVCVVEARYAHGWQRHMLSVILGLCALAAMYTHMLGFVLTVVFGVGVIANSAVRPNKLLEEQLRSRRQILKYPTAEKQSALKALLSPFSGLLTLIAGRFNVWRQNATSADETHSHIPGNVGVGLRPARTKQHISTLSTLFTLACLFVAVLLSLPYAQSLWALYQSGRPLGAEINPLGAFAAAEVPDVIFSALLTGRAWVIAPFLLTGLVLICVVVVCLRYKSKALPLAVITVTGIGAMIMLALAADLYKPRYLTPFAAPLLALLAGAILLPKRVLWRSALLLGVVAFTGAGLLADFDRTLRDDWTAAAQFVQTHEQTEDTIIIIPDWGGEAFRYHYRGAASVTSLLPGVSEEIDLDTLLRPLVEGHGRVWYVWYQPLVSDPQALADSWFRARAVTVTEVFPSGIQVKLYDFDPILETLPESARPLDAVFGGVMALRGLEMPITRGSARDTRLHPPSMWVQIIFYWESLRDGVNVVPRVRLTDGIGQVYGGAVQRDNDLLLRFPPSSWLPGQIVRTATDLNLNPGMPSGIYNIEVMVLDEAGQPLPASGADAGAQWVIAGQYTV